MESFKDKNGKNWIIEINVGSARRVKAECGIDLLSAVTVNSEGINTSVLDSIGSDAYMLVNVILSLCRKQIDEQNITDEDFLSYFDGETIQSATDSVIKEIINFSQPSKRKMLSLIYTKVKGFRAEAEQQVEKVLNNANFLTELDNQLKEQFTSSQEYSE